MELFTGHFVFVFDFFVDFYYRFNLEIAVEGGIIVQDIGFTVFSKNFSFTHRLEKPILSLTLKQKNAERHYQIGKQKDQDSYVLKVSDREEYFQLPTYTVKPLLENITQEKWLMDKPQPEKEEEPVEESGEIKLTQ